MPVEAERRRTISDSCHVRSLYRSFTAVGGTSSFTIQSSTVLIFPHELLQQENVNILVANDGGHKDDYGSFGWVIGTETEIIWDCQGVARLLQSHRAEGMVLSLFLTTFATTASKRQITCVSRLTATAKISRTRNLFIPGCGLIKLVFEV
jgi:hypothetical protein